MASGHEDGRPSSGQEEMKKPSASTFHPTLWGDFFLSHEPPTSPQEIQMRERAEVLRQEVRKIIKGSNNDLPAMLDLIITLQRLSLDYHYEDEISEMLHNVYNSNHYDGDLNVVSRRFYLLRKSGYNVPSDVFLKFQDKQGNFVDADIRSLLSLYNAAYLRTHREPLLDEAISFTRKCFQGGIENLESPLAEEVSFALDTPLFRRVGILETRNFIPIYEKEATRKEAILEFAKLNFNLLQLLYCEELKDVTAWWKNLNVEANFHFVRNRIVEMYFWMNGACHEPQYSHSRIILAKMMGFITILDDFIDTYATTEESTQLAEAVFRWDKDAINLLPEYTRDFYMFLLKTFCSFEEELGTGKSYRVFYLKKALKQLVQAYIEELKWRDENYIPETLSEHLGLSMRSSGGSPILCASLVGMGEIVTRETLDWFLSYPQLVRSFDTFVRLSDDMASTEREQKGDHNVSTVQCYMKEHGTTMHEACKRIKELTEDLWKDMVQHHLASTEQTAIVSRMVLNLARTGDYMYQNNVDKFTSSHTIKEAIRRLFVEPIPV
ncbi:(S)-beta-macrocarpene synthase-like [Panicum miliaceum]|uniref:(S)-beta-macrocarpene synthase-like n=1 Tax=Panicum miliaceum TaxID=4540 RepID=A0A3L6PM25_PANMI|nr:(S)-beta-macrocarpene synthase-like [Panicum miliaceum]